MNIIQQAIKSFISDYNLNNPDFIYLVAFSGGYDSMCLLDALKKVCTNRIVAIHLNHNWRGDESDKEEQNCANFCKTIGVEFYCEKLPQEIAHTETEARNERYKFFEQCAEKFKSKIIFTAHNKNDNVETLIFRICHGTGISGLSGIALHRDIYYRPILNIERKEIENYCQKNNLNPNFDSSNTDTIHKRNLIRQEILPLMQQINPNIINSINSLSEIAREETSILDKYIKEILQQISKEGKISTQKFLKLSDAIQTKILYNIITPLVPCDYDRERISTILKFIKENYTSKSGKKISVTTGFWMFVNEKFIELISQKENTKIDIHINTIGEYRNDGIVVNISECNRYPDEGTKFSDGTIYVDFGGVDFDFNLRNREDGDFIQPSGMTGTQKLKKYLNSKKIPNHEKDELLFLTQGKEILWAIGLGLNEKIRVKKNPTHKIVIRRESYGN